MLTPQTCYLHEASVSNDFGGRWLVFLKNPFNLIQKDYGMKQERVLGKSHPFQTSKEILEVYFNRALRNIKLLKLRGPTQQWALFTLEILRHGEAWTSQSWRQVPNTDQANRPGLANCEATKHIFLNKHFLNQGDALWKKIFCLRDLFYSETKRATYSILPKLVYGFHLFHLFKCLLNIFSAPDTTSFSLRGYCICSQKKCFIFLRQKKMSPHKVQNSHQL